MTTQEITEKKLEHISINLFGYGDREAPIHEVEEASRNNAKLSNA
jgi:hypothetical protein